MSEDLSLLTILDSASWPVVAIILLLIGLSCISWSIVIRKYLFFISTKHNITEFEKIFWSGIDFIKINNDMHKKPEHKSGLEYIFSSGFNEFTRQNSLNVFDVDKLFPHIRQAIRMSVMNEQRKLEQTLPMLASIGSISPYIGLLGTVVGIISSFFSLAVIQQPTLKTIAPGIAEALITTALGLVVAIPAIFFYNKLTVYSEQLISRCDGFAEEFYAILSKKSYIVNNLKESNNDDTQ